MTNKLDLNTDIIDVREIIERLEELEGLLHEHLAEHDDSCIGDWAEVSPEEHKELSMLVSLMEEMAGYGGDEQWRGDWYPVTLIAESYFVEYITELIHDCYEMPKEMHSGNWPYRHMTIDYAAAADEAKGDYSEIEIEGATYFYR